VSITDLIGSEFRDNRGVYTSRDTVSVRDLISPNEKSLFLFKLFPTVSQYLAVLEMRTNISIEHATSIFRE
jgi:hypothetical protein